jgi:tetratricopeptide (TPR) repeat protein
MRDFNPFDEPTDDQLWENYGSGDDRTKLDAARELGDRLMFRRKWSEAMALFEEAQRWATKLNWRIDYYQMVDRIAFCIARLGRVSEALTMFDEHEVQARADLDPGDLAYFFRGKAKLYYFEQMAVSAIEYYSAARELAIEANDTYMAADDARRIAKCHILLGEYGVAGTLLDAAIEEAQEEAPLHLVLALMHTRAKLFIEVGEHARAAELIREAIDCEEFDPFHDITVSMKLTLATALICLGDRAEASELLASLGNSVVSPRSERRITIQMLQAEMATGHEAQRLRERARARAHADGQFHLANAIDITLASDLAANGRGNDAARFLRRAIKSAEEHNDTSLVFEARIRLAALMVSKGRADLALGQLDRFTDAQFGENFMLACRYRAVRAAALADVGRLDEAESTLSWLFAIDPVVEHFLFLADAHYITANIELARAGRTEKWKEHLGKSAGFLALAGDPSGAAARTIEFLDEDFVHPERVIDEFEYFEGVDDEFDRDAA